MTGRQLVDPAEHRERRGRREEAQVVIDGKILEIPWDVGMGQKGLDLGGEQKAARGPREIEGLDADAIAREKEAARSRVPDPDREHALEMVENGGGPLSSSLDDSNRAE